MREPNPRANFRLESLSHDFADKANRERWLTVLEQVKAGTMPPKGKPRPPAKDVEALADWISGRAAAAEAARSAAQGRVVLRRLNRAEYENTVRDLLGVDVDLKDLLPVGHVDQRLRQRRRGAARLLLPDGAATWKRPTGSWTRPSPTGRSRGRSRSASTSRTRRAVKPTGSVYRHVDDGVAIFSSWVSANIQVTLWQFLPAIRGKYRFRISGYGFQTDKPVTFHVMAGTADGGDRAAPGRLLRRARRQADRGRVRRAAGAAEHDSDRRGRTGRDAARGREGRGGELQGAGTGRAVGRGRRAAARLLAAGEPSPALRRPAAGAAPPRRPQPPSRSSRSSPWPMPSGSSATSPAAPFGGR